MLADTVLYSAVALLVSGGCYLAWVGIEALADLWVAARARRSRAGFVPSPPVRMSPSRLDARPRSDVDRARVSVLPRANSRVVDLNLAARVAACRRSVAPSSPFTVRQREGLANFSQRRQVSPSVTPWGGEGGAA